MHYVYLAGPITGMQWEEAKGGWRKMLADQMFREVRDGQLAFLSPMRDHHPETHAGVWHRKLELARDIADIKRSTCMVVGLMWAERVSVGTMVECGIARAFNIPMIFWMEDKRNSGEHNVHEHVWMDLGMLPDFRTQHLDEVAKAIRFMTSKGL